MKKRGLLYLLLTCMLLACSSQILVSPAGNTPTTPVPPTSAAQQAPFNIAWDDYSSFQKRLSSAYQDVPGRLTGASVYHISFNISDPPTHITGVEEVRYTNQETVALDEIDFAIFPEILGGSITVLNLTVDNVSTAMVHGTGLMRVPLASPLQPGSSVIFHMGFEITVPTQGGDYYYGIFGYNDGILSMAHAYPTILVYNQQGWNNQVPDLDGDPLFSDTSFYLVSVNASEALVLAASGLELNRTSEAGRQQVLYADGPSRDFYLAASTGFSKQSETVGELTVNSYAPSDLASYAHSAMKTAEAAIADFSRRYAPYPYTEFNIVPIITSAGGVEFPGLTAVARNVYNSSNFLEVVVTHEVGHQWFYNLVGNSTQGQPWLDESLAEFVTWQYYLDEYGPQGAQSYRDEMQGTWNILDDQAIPIGQPVSAYTSDGYVAIVYGRGPLFMLALRDQMGTEVFDRFMQDYTRSNEWSIATTTGFEQLAEQDCSCDLTPLFDDWVFSK